MVGIRFDMYHETIRDVSYIEMYGKKSRDISGDLMRCFKLTPSPNGEKGLQKGKKLLRKAVKRVNGKEVREYWVGGEGGVGMR
jgi:hypothetical protein